ncbi:unnamed protein product, partial [Rotaria sordida]
HNDRRGHNGHNGHNRRIGYDHQRYRALTCIQNA